MVSGPQTLPGAPARQRADRRPADHRDRRTTVPARAWGAAAFVPAAVASGAAGLAFHRLFGYQPLLRPVCVAVVVPTLLAVAQSLARTRIPLAVSSAVSAGLWAGLACVVVAPAPHGWPVTGTALSTVASGVLNGWAQLLNITVPVPPRPELLAVPFTLAWLAASIGAETVLRTRAVLAPVVPALLVFTAAVALSVPGTGSNLPEAGAVTVSAASLVLLRNVQAGTAIAGILLMLAVTAAALAAGPVSLSHRSAVNPRQYWPVPVQPVAAVNPLDQVAGWLARPGVPLFKAWSSHAADWRLAVLDTFNGQRWTSSARFTPAGLGVPWPPGARRSQLVRQRFQIGRLGGSLLPAANRPVSIQGPRFSVDTGTGMLLSGQPLRPGLAYTAVSRVIAGPAPGQLAGLTAAAGPGVRADLSVPPGVPAVYALARDAMRLGTAASAYQRAYLLEQYLQGRFANNPRSPAGYTDGDLSRFLATHVGTCVQFAAAFTLAARVLGIPSRLVVGFTHGNGGPGRDGYQVRSGDALVWSEADFAGAGWMPFFPTPAPSPHPRAAASGPAEGETAGQARSQARALRLQPGRFGQVVSPHPNAVTVPARGHGWLLAGIVCAAGAGAACYLGVVPLAASVRRRRRRNRGTPQDRIVGAWHDLLEQLTDMGMAPSPGASNSAIVAASSQASGNTFVPELSSLAVLVSRALFAEAEPTEQQAVRAWRYRDKSRELMRRATPPRRRLRARLTPRIRSRPGAGATPRIRRWPRVSSTPPSVHGTRSPGSALARDGRRSQARG
jgi:transglutaminase-like putative cysteine protease